MGNRIDIRKNLLTKLKNLDVGGRVYMSRMRPMYLTELPCICLYFTSETADNKNTSPRIYTKLLSVNVDIFYGADSPEVDDFLDAVAFSVENEFLADRFLNGLVDDISLIETQAMSIDPEGENRFSALRQVYVIKYESGPMHNTNDIEEFLKYNADWKNENN